MKSAPSMELNSRFVFWVMGGWQSFLWSKRRITKLDSYFRQIARLRLAEGQLLSLSNALEFCSAGVGGGDAMVFVRCG
jgi:hypothetical protein